MKFFKLYNEFFYSFSIISGPKFVISDMSLIGNPLFFILVAICFFYIVYTNLFWFCFI